MLAYYWQLGRDIVNLDAENRWGSGFMRMLSQDLKQELPEATGLTRTNLYYCKKFYLLYNQANMIVPQVEGKLQDEKLPQLGAEIQTLVSAVPKARIERYYNDHGTICVF